MDNSNGVYFDYTAGSELIRLLGYIGSGNDEGSGGAILGLDFGEYNVAASSDDFGDRIDKGTNFPANAEYMPYYGKPGAMRAEVVCTTTNTGTRTVVVRASQCGDPQLNGRLIRMSLAMLLQGLAGKMPSS